MPKAYLIAQADVTEPESYALYVKGTAQAALKYRAKVLARGGTREILEGKGRARVVILEFESLDLARAYYNSAEYQAAAKHRQGCAEFDSLIVEGI